ncbi:cyclopropane-mycolic acid synthase [Bradyrhizobium sp. CCBAU 51745]|uniref:SAM-dependent methyltransferase n=1 Tax=Bradyrhizobium sp. CCBAU 51745 TaxID=1325099 RepID=UPI00230550A7|nr:cyclopropane-fatty-acyl-phospholipid synthase family protein [Bradyrhizobium sp. CCBAU 51745]MDA9444356.1 cyclopropane-mycolic acid synthase [Bradyrhizobium sp. CCBAU 51745]
MATQAEISYHYDVDNDFYAAFLDKDHMAYSCGVWDGALDLEHAQKQKLARIASFARVKASDRVMDVGCGWGGLIRYALDELGAASAVGLTLSNDQFAYISGRSREAIRVELRSWADYPTPTEKFDAVMSVGAFEHFASMEDRAENVHRDVYRKFFQWCSDISVDKASLGLQTIISTRPPRDLSEVRDVRFLLEDVFRGSALPYIDDVLEASNGVYEVMELRRIGKDYSRTLSEWKARLIKSRAKVIDRYGESLFHHYERYFDSSERVFNSGLVDLLQVSLRKKAQISNKLARPTNGRRPWRAKW